MANPLPNEDQLYEQIKNNGITVEPGIWDLIYHRVGDDITAINLLCQYYLTNKEAIPIIEAERILAYTKDIKNTINTITTKSKDNFPFPQFKENIPLHPVIRELFTHHMGNDVHSINLMVGDTIDPIDPRPIPLEITERILNRTRIIKGFLEKLREATSK